MANRSKKIIRTDLLPTRMNAGKRRAVDHMLRGWRRTAERVSSEQWRLFYQAGRFNKQHQSGCSGIVSAACVQMVQWQVVGMLDSFMANRSNDFRRIVHRSTLPADVRHHLHTINRWNRWFSGLPEAIKDGSDIPVETRAVARSIMRHLLKRHRKPSMKHINMMVDQRHAVLASSTTSAEFPLWLKLRTNERKDGKKQFKTVDIPLKSYDHHDRRVGERAKTVQIVERDGEIYAGVMTDVTETMAASRELGIGAPSAEIRNENIITEIPASGGPVPRLRDHHHQQPVGASGRYP